jgi:hypothetical protein
MLMDNIRQSIGYTALTTDQLENVLSSICRPFEKQLMDMLHTHTNKVTTALHTARPVLRDKQERPYFRALLCSHFILNHVYIPLQGLAQDHVKAGNLLDAAVWYDLAFGVAHAIQPILVADADADGDGASIRTSSAKRAEQQRGEVMPERLRVAVQRLLEGDMADWAALVRTDPTGKKAIKQKVAQLHAEAEAAHQAATALQHIAAYQIPELVLFGADLAERFYGGLYPLSASS